MDTIRFENKVFKIRKIDLPEFGNILISTTNLNQLLMNEDGGYTSGEAEIVDEQIFYFVDENEIEYEQDKLIKMLSRQLHD